MTHLPQTLGVVLARAGSQGLPGKHLRALLGRPVIAHAFDHAVAAETLSRVVVTSDCPTIRRLAAERRLPSVERPPELCTSDASVQDTLLHALDAVEARTSWRAEAIVILYGNVPVRPVGAIDRCVRHLAETGCCSVRTFAPVGKWHPGWMAALDGDVVRPTRPGSIHRRQDLEPLFLHDGGCVAMSRAALERGRSEPGDPHAMFGVDRRGVQVEAGATVEVDCERDLFLAEAALRARGSAGMAIRMAA